MGTVQYTALPAKEQLYAGLKYNSNEAMVLTITEESEGTSLLDLIVLLTIEMKND